MALLVYQLLCATPTMSSMLFVRSTGPRCCGWGLLLLLPPLLLLAQHCTGVRECECWIG